MDLLTKLFRWPFEAAARRRIANAHVRVISSRETKTPTKAFGMDVPLTETHYTIQWLNGQQSEITWSDPMAQMPEVAEAMRDWDIVHGGK